MAGPASPFRPFSPFPPNPHDLNYYGQALRTLTFLVTSAFGGVAGTTIIGGSSTVFQAPAWIVGLQASATFAINTTGAKYFAVGIDNGSGFVLPSNNILLAFVQQLGTTTKTDVPISKGGAVFYQWPFLPYIDTGQRVTGYAPGDLAVGEQLTGVVTVSYVVCPAPTA
jgi:hypothetical protein